MEDIYDYLRYTANLISDSRFKNKIFLKGGSVLISKMIENGRNDLYRLTGDLDIHCDKKDIWIDFYEHIENILNGNNRGYVYKIVKRRSAEKGLDTSDSLTFTLADGDKIIRFKMDMNIKSNRLITVDYSPLLNMNTYDALTILADKIAVVSSDKIFRRIKDLYDIAALASLYSFRYSDVMEHLNTKHPNIVLKNMLVLSDTETIDKIEHAYNKYEGILNKPDIRELIIICYSFLEPVYMEYSKGDLIWDMQTAAWQKI